MSIAYQCQAMPRVLDRCIDISRRCSLLRGRRVAAGLLFSAGVYRPRPLTSRKRRLQVRL